MKLLKSKSKNKNKLNSICVQTKQYSNFNNMFNFNSVLENNNAKVYLAIREAIPIVDAAINKIIRLVGSFKIKIENEYINKQLNSFLQHVKVGSCCMGINTFISCYLDSMLTFGNAMGEIVLNPESNYIFALYNTNINDIKIDDSNPLLAKFYVKDGLTYIPIKQTELILFSTLNPLPGSVKGSSLMKGLPFISNILLKIYNSIGLNFDRIGNVRFAINYKPGSNSMDSEYAKEVANNIASEWEHAMTASVNGEVRDFVVVGDVDIKVIGADNKTIDTAVPVKQMLEQIVAKTGIPPFLLGLNWSSTERMSKQQCEILISEIESYRRLLTPIICKIVTIWSKLNNYNFVFEVNWDKINLHDEIVQARAKLMLTQAKRLQEQENPIN